MLSYLEYLKFLNNISVNIRFETVPFYLVALSLNT